MDIAEIELFIEKVPLFSGLPLDERSAIAKSMILRPFNQDETIVFENDDKNQSIFIIVSGSVNVVIYTSEGKQTVLASLIKGDFFGEMALLDGEPRSASVIAAKACTLLILYRRDFLATLESYPQIAIQMLIELSKRLRKSNRHITTLSLMSVYGRVADVLLTLGKEKGKRVGNMILIPSRPTHQEIADMSGTTRETVSRIISQLVKKRYITIDRKRLVILDEKKLYD